MSASKEKKIRKEQRNAADWVDNKAIQAEKDKQAHKKTNLLFAVAVVLFVAIGIFSFIFNSGFMQKQTDAVTVNGESYSPAQVQYYYVNTYQNFVEQNYYYLSYYGLNTASSLKAQQCLLMEDGTWYDYFVDAAVNSMADIQALCDAAEKDNFPWSDEMQADYDSQLAYMEAGRISYNETNSTSLNMDGYLEKVFGRLVTEEIFKEEVKRSVVATAYADAYVNSLEYSDSQIQDAYNNGKLEFDRVSYNSLRVSGAASTTDADGKTVTPTDADKAAAMDEAKALAEELLAKAQKGETLKDLSSAYQKANLTTSDSASYYEDVVMEWLFDESRKPGDLTVLKNDDMSYYYVVQFNERFRHDYNTVNVRHILLTGGTGTLTSEDAGYEQQQSMLKDMAMAEAEMILMDWANGEATEASFAALANKHSQDGGSNTKGGLYEQVYAGQMVNEFGTWCFDETRKPGDTGIIYSEDTGAHVMYFVGEDRPYWEVQVIDSLKSKAYTEWYEGKTAGYDYVINDFGMSAVG